MDYLLVAIVGALVAGVGVLGYKKLSTKPALPKESVKESVSQVQSTASPVQPNNLQTPVAPPQAQSQPAQSPFQKPDLDNTPVVIEARARAKEYLVEVKSQALKIRTQADEDARKIKEEALELEKRILVQKAEVEAKEKEIETKLKQVKTAKEIIEKKQEELEEGVKKQQDALEKISNLTKEEAKKQLLDSVDRMLAEEKGKKIREYEQNLRTDSDKIAQDILVSAMRFGATDYVVEHTTSKIKLPDEDIKGRIIGKEGRNIKTFEELTGVDLEIDSASNEIMISCFDPIRREIARIALEKLLADGRIQPAKIEEMVEKAKAEIEHVMFKEGDNLCHKLGAYNLPKDIIQMLGRFKYRFSYGQNMIEHTLEETRIGVAIARELNANVEVVRLGCLFHDIGKIVTEDEGTHIQLGVDLLRKFKVSEDVVNCVAEHHEDRPFSSIESAIVNLADHVSGARPAARSEDYESYVKRLKALEEAAMSFQGVDKAFAVSAGREVRVFVSPERVDDYSVAFLAKEIAKKIELEQTYPGVVKVIVIRETRVIETAK